jgi:hypothetical protein
MTNTMRFSRLRDPLHIATTFVFAHNPPASSLPFDFIGLGPKDKVLPGGGGGSSGNLFVMQVQAPRESVQKARLKFFPAVKQLVFHLPEIPGLPTENRGVQNLFKVRIPYVRVNGEYELREIIESTVQLRFGPSVAFNPPPGYFPHVFTNQTAENLLAENLQYLPDRRHVKVNMATEEILLEEPFARELIKVLRKKLSGN